MHATLVLAKVRYVKKIRLTFKIKNSGVILLSAVRVHLLFITIGCFEIVRLHII